MIKLVLSLPLIALLGLIPLISAQNVTLINQTANNMNYFFTDASISITYPAIFLVGFIFTALSTFRLRKEPWAIMFGIISTVFCILLALIFLSPQPLVFETEQEHIIITEVNNTVTTQYFKGTDDAVILPKSSQFRFVFSSLFSVLSIVFGLISIIIITDINKRR